METVETEKIVSTAEMFEIVGNELKEKNAEIERLRNDNNRLAWLAIDNAKDTGRALMYCKILQQIADEGSGHGQALAYAALKEKE